MINTGIIKDHFYFNCTWTFIPLTMLVRKYFNGLYYIGRRRTIWLFQLNISVLYVINDCMFNELFMINK